MTSRKADAFFGRRDVVLRRIQFDRYGSDSGADSAAVFLEIFAFKSINIFRYLFLFINMLLQYQNPEFVEIGDGAGQFSLQCGINACN